MRVQWEILPLILPGVGREVIFPAKLRGVPLQHLRRDLNERCGLALDPLDLPVVDLSSVPPLRVPWLWWTLCAIASLGIKVIFKLPSVDYRGRCSDFAPVWQGG